MTLAAYWFLGYKIGYKLAAIRVAAWHQIDADKGLIHEPFKSMFGTVTLFSSLAIIKTVKGANEITSYAANALKLEPLTNQIGFRVNKRMAVHKGLRKLNNGLVGKTCHIKGLTTLELTFVSLLAVVRAPRAKDKVKEALGRLGIPILLAVAVAAA